MKKITREEKVKIKNEETLSLRKRRELHEKREEQERIAIGDAFREQQRRGEARERKYQFLEEENERFKVKILNLQMEVDQLRRELLLSKS